MPIPALQFTYGDTRPRMLVLTLAYADRVGEEKVWAVPSMTEMTGSEVKPNRYHMFSINATTGQTESLPDFPYQCYFWTYAIATRCAVLSQEVLGGSFSQAVLLPGTIRLRLRYAMSGTGMAYGTSAICLRGEVRLRPRCAMPGTDLAYAGHLLLGDGIGRLLACPMQGTSLRARYAKPGTDRAYAANRRKPRAHGVALGRTPPSTLRARYAQSGTHLAHAPTRRMVLRSRRLYAGTQCAGLGTEIAYGATPEREADHQFLMPGHSPYAMSGTDLAYGAVICYAMSGTDLAHAGPATSLRARYAMSGTDLAYASAPVPSMRCLWRVTAKHGMRLHPEIKYTKPHSCVLAWRTASGTDIAYAEAPGVCAYARAMRCPRMVYRGNRRAVVCVVGNRGGGGGGSGGGGEDGEEGEDEEGGRGDRGGGAGGGRAGEGGGERRKRGEERGERGGRKGTCEAGPIVLRDSYAMSGTDVAYTATRSPRDGGPRYKKPTLPC
eukprot:5435-Rhodomonas_salina.3